MSNPPTMAMTRASLPFRKLADAFSVRRQRKAASCHLLVSSPFGRSFRSRRLRDCGWLAGGRRLGGGPGSGWSEELACGVRAGRAGCRDVPRLPSRARRSAAGLCGLAGVGAQAGVDGVADPALEAAQGFLGCLALGDLLVVILAAVAVRVAELGDGGHVDGVVEAAVAALGQPVDDPA